MTPEEKQKAREEGKAIGEVVADKLKDSLGVDRKTTGAKNIVAEGFSASNVFGQDSKPGKVFDPTEEQKNELGDTVKDRFVNESIGSIKDSLGVRRETEGFGNIMKEGFSAANVFGADSFLGKVFSTDEQRDVAREYAKENKKDEVKSDGTASSASLSQVHDVLVEIKDELQEPGKSGDSEKKNLTDNKKILALMAKQNDFAKKTAETSDKIRLQGKKTNSLLETLIARGGMGGGGGGGGGLPLMLPPTKGGGFLSKAKDFGKNALKSGKNLLRGGAMRAAAPLMVAGAAYEGYQGYKEADQLVESGAINEETGQAFTEADETAGKTEAVTGAVGSVAGGVGGMKAGAAAGAAIGAFFGGVGAVPGAFIGGAIGGAVGFFAGGKIGEGVGDAFTTTSGEAALEAAEESGLYDKDMLGNSEINPEILAQTTDPAQLQAIIADGDLSDEDMQMVQARLEEIGGSRGNTSNSGGGKGVEVDLKDGSTVTVSTPEEIEELVTQGKLDISEAELAHTELSNDSPNVRVHEGGQPSLFSENEKESIRQTGKRLRGEGSDFEIPDEELDRENFLIDYDLAKVDQETAESNLAEFEAKHGERTKENVINMGIRGDRVMMEYDDPEVQAQFLKLQGKTVKAKEERKGMLAQEMDRVGGKTDEDKFRAIQERTGMSEDEVLAAIGGERTDTGRSYSPGKLDALLQVETEKGLTRETEALYGRQQMMQQKQLSYEEHLGGELSDAEKGKRALREMAARMGIDASQKVEGRYTVPDGETPVVTSVNGRSTAEFLTPEEQQLLQEQAEYNADIEAAYREGQGLSGNTNASVVENATDDANTATAPGANAPVVVQAPAPAPQPTPSVNVVVSMPKSIGPQDKSGIKFIGQLSNDY